MKKASQIVNSLQNKPQFSKLLKYKCISKIQSMFMPLVQKMIKFAYIKNDTLFFVLTQAKEELFYLERAKGDFEITVHDEKLHTLIASIQKIIKEKKCN